MIRIIRTLVIVNIGLMMFRAVTLADGFGMFTGLFKYAGKSSDLISVIDLNDLIVALASCACLIAVDCVKEYKIDVRAIVTDRKLAIRYASLLAIIVVIIVFGAYGDGYIPVDPIYGGF